MQYVVVTSCTNRKRLPSLPQLTARTLAPGDPVRVAGEWVKRLGGHPRMPAARLYCGRSFREAYVAADELRAPLYIISAGLGLLEAKTDVPSYSLTTAGHAEDNILTRTVGGDPQRWWQCIMAVSPYAVPLSTLFGSSRLVLMAAPSSYVQMLADDLASLSAAQLRRIRLFSKIDRASLPVQLRPIVMPYDGRLEGRPDFAGTQGDFPQRALRHFVRLIREGDVGRSVEDHHKAVECALRGIKPRITPDRRRLSDEQVIELIQKHWLEAEGQSSKMLRVLRDKLQVACEQGRFRDLFRRVQQQGELL